MKVLKFGGTSVGTPESLRSVREIVMSQPEPCVVVVSALGGITDRLLSVAAKAAEGVDFSAELSEIHQRHRCVVDEMLSESNREEIWRDIKHLLSEFEAIITAIGVLRELTPRSEALVASFGERMSCLIVTAMIPQARLAHSLDFIRTKQRLGKNVLDTEGSAELIAGKFSELKDAKVVVVPGFISRGDDGRITNLGRGGSDYTAAILASELNARVLEIWTDVDGFMSADPRRVKDAQVIDRLSFAEAMELCNFGAKVVYPPTIYPVFHKNIPILIKNTFNPTAPGTLIAESREGKAPDDCNFLGVSAIADTALIELIGATKDDYERMINTLSRNGLEPLIPDGVGRCGVHKKNAEKAQSLLADEFASELINRSISEIRLVNDLAMTAIIGRGSCPASTAEDFNSALNLAGIPVIYGPLPASPGTVAAMIPAPQLTAALQTIHSEFIK